MPRQNYLGYTKFKINITENYVPDESLNFELEEDTI